MKAIRVLKIWSSGSDFHTNYIEDFRNHKNYVMIMVNTRALCSGACCGNPCRQKFPIKDKITLQEKRANDSFNDQLIEIEEVYNELV